MKTVRSLKPRLGLLLLASLLVFCSSSRLYVQKTTFRFTTGQDASHRPLKGVEIGVMGNGGSDVSDIQGKARIKLGNQTREGTSVSLQIVPHRSAPIYVFLSPLDGRVIVPSFNSEANNFVGVTLVKPGDKMLLSNDLFISVVTLDIGQSMASGSARRTGTQTTYTSIAKHVELPEVDVKRAVSERAARTTDPFESGLNDMAQGHFEQAIPKLEASLKQRSERHPEDKAAVFHAAYQLGLATYAAGDYESSLKAMEQAEERRPNSVLALEERTRARGDKPSERGD